MSSPAQGEPSAPKEKRGLGKVLARARTVIKRADPSRRLSFLQPKATPGESSKAAGKKPEVPAAAAEPELPEGARKIPKSQIYEERARKLGERFGLQIQPSEWHSTEGDAVRVEKPIRMRIHRVCHKCDTAFGAAKECPSCKHVKCSKCVRYPAKRTEEEKQASRDRRAAKAKALAENPRIEPDYGYTGEPPILKRPSKTGGQDLVLKKPRQRVRRNCHECGTLFLSGTKTCGKCSHVRCTDCPRDPSKKDKYPYGYPGDEFGPSAVPHFSCHQCNKTFPPDAPNDTECSKCSHPKCDTCPRITPRKVEPEPDPDVLKAVQAKLANLSVT